MKKLMKKLISSILVSAMLVAGVSDVFVSAQEAVTSGSYGDDVFWEYNGASHILAITGTGQIPDSDNIRSDGKNATTAPWGDFSEEIEKVIIGGGVFGIGSYAFYNCTSLRTVVFANAGDTPDSSWSCEAVSPVVIPGGSGSSGDNTSGEVIVTPGGGNVSSGDITVIPGGTVTVNPGGTVTVSPGVSVIQPGEVIVVPGGDTEDTEQPKYRKIGELAFSGTAVERMDIPQYITSIGRNAFSDCKNLKQATIPSAVDIMGETVFSGCTALESIGVDGANKDYMSLDGVLFNKTGTRLYQYPAASTRTEYEIPDTVKTVYKEAFSNSINLTYVKIPDSVKTVKQYAFENCEYLQAVYLGKSISKIDMCAFKNCTRLKSAELPPALTAIDVFVFSNCASLKTVLLPKSVTVVSGFAFQGCSGLTDVYYSGTPDELYAVTIQSGNDCFTGASFTCNYNGTTSPSLDYAASTLIIDGKEVKVTVYEYGTLVKIEDADLRCENGTLYLSKEGYYDVSFAVSSLDFKDSLSLALVPESTKTDTAAVHCNGTDALCSSVSVSREKNEALTVTVRGTSGVKGYRLCQNGSVIAENGTGYFSLEAGMLQTSPITVKTKDENGVWSKTLSTGIKVINSVKIKADVGKIFSFDIPDSVPLVGGETFELSLADLPVAVEVDAEKGTYAVAIGYNKDLMSSSDEERKSNFRNFKETFKNFREDKQSINDFREEMKKKGFKSGMETIKWKWGLSWEVTGYLEGTFDENGIASVSGNVLFALEGSGGGTWQTALWATVPVTVKLKVSAKAAVLLGAEISEGNITWLIPAMDLTLPKIKLSAGPGFKALNASIYGEASNIIHIEDALTTASLKGEVGISAKAFMFSGEVPILSGTLTYYNSASGQKAASIPLNRAAYRSMLKDPSLYTVNSAEETSEWYGDFVTPSVSMYAESQLIDKGGISSKTLQTDVYTAAEPKIVEAGDTRLMIWTATVSDRSPVNSAAVVYSLYDSAADTWSAPKIIADDGTADCNPDIATDGERIFAVWTNANEELPDDAGIGDIGAHLELCVAEYNTQTAVWSQAVAVTDNEAADIAPDIYAENGVAIVSWIENANNDVLGLTGVNKIKCAVFDGENITSVTTAAQSEVPVYSTETGRFGDSLSVAYICEGDTLLCAGTEGEELYCSQKGVLSVRFAEADGENIMLAVTQDGFSAIYPDTNSCTLLPDGAVSKTFEALTLPDGRYAVITALANSGEMTDAGSNIYVYIFDGQTAGEALPLTNCEGYASSVSGIYANGEIITVYNNATVNISESSVTETADLCTACARFVRRTELSGVEYDCSVAAPGALLPVTVTVKNTGFETEKALNIAVTDGTQAIYEGTVSCSIGAGQTAEVVFDLPVPKAVDCTEEYTITVTAEGEEAGDENKSSFALGYADVDISLSNLVSGNCFAVLASVSNNTPFGTNTVLNVYAEDSAGEKEKKASYSLGYICGNSSRQFRIEASMISGFAKDGDTLYFEAETEIADCSLGNNSDFTVVKFAGYETVGDLNGDGKVTSKDVNLLRRMITGTEEITLSADFDTNDKINAKDAILLRRILVGQS